MPYTPISNALLEQAIAARALTQLNRTCIFPKVATVGYEPGAFERGESVKVRRPKRRQAADLDPRVAAATMTETSFFNASVTLERLWIDGFPIYGHDPAQAVEKYIEESALQIADAIATPNDDYMYSAYRTWSLPSTGSVALGAHPPVAVVAAVDSSGQLTDFNNTVLRSANTVLDTANVPSTSRFSVISSVAKGAFLGDAVVVTGFVATQIGGGELVQQGLQQGAFVERYGFKITGSNTVTGQSASLDLDTTGGSQGTLAIASCAANTAFTVDDEATTTYAGAVDFTLTVTGSLQNVAVGQIARIGTSSKATAFGVVLRVASNVVTLIPYTPTGSKLGAAQITPGTDVFSIPSIPSVNVCNHQEGLLMATRQIAAPSEGSGVKAASIMSPETGLSMQVFRGGYDITRVREFMAAYLLTGTRFSDWRKGALML